MILNYNEWMEKVFNHEIEIDEDTSFPPAINLALKYAKYCGVSPDEIAESIIVSVPIPVQIDGPVYSRGPKNALLKTPVDILGDEGRKPDDKGRSMVRNRGLKGDIPYIKLPGGTHLYPLSSVEMLHAKANKRGRRPKEKN